MDTYSNILFIKENYSELSNLAFKCYINDKYRPETCCVIGNFYGLKGQLLCYHFYKPEMLRDAARKSKFCIMLDNEETQGLAALEIMACGCPIFCIDRNYYKSNNKVMEGSVTSIVSWSPQCGIKTTEEVWKSDFETFLSSLSSFTPAKFVHENYSYKESARKLMTIAFKVRSLEQETELSLD